LCDSMCHTVNSNLTKSFTGERCQTICSETVFIFGHPVGLHIIRSLPVFVYGIYGVYTEFD